MQKQNQRNEDSIESKTEIRDREHRQNREQARDDEDLWQREWQEKIRGCQNKWRHRREKCETLRRTQEPSKKEKKKKWTRKKEKKKTKKKVSKRKKQEKKIKKKKEQKEENEEEEVEEMSSLDSD